MEILKTPALRLGFFLAAGLFAASRCAAAAPPPAAGDPFIKKDTPVLAAETGPVFNIIFTVETYKLRQSDGARLIQENETDEARYDGLLDLLKKGKAHLDMVMSGAQSPGEELTIEQVMVFKYGVAWNFFSGKNAEPTDFKERNIGYRLVLKSEPVADPKTGLFLYLFFENDRFDGFIDQPFDGFPYQPAAQDWKAVFSMPKFITSRMPVNHAYLPFGKMRFLGTQSVEPTAAQIEDPEMTLVFGKMDLIPLTPDAPTTGKTTLLEHQLSLYSMSREQAVRILNQKQEMDSAYQAVQSLVKTGEARLEHLAVARSDGKKASLNEVTEMPYRLEINRTEHVTQDTGYTADITAKFIANTSLLSLDLDTRWVRYLGDLHGVTLTPTHGIQPIFEVPGVETQLHSALGEHEFVGTFSPAANTGLVDPKATGRVWFEFIRTTAVNP